jgi:predicted nucleic acid-binding protein
VTTFVDTSALYAALDRDDDAHGVVAPVLRALLETEELLTSSHVVVETAALVQRRLGAEATRDLLERLVPVLEVTWVDESLHRAGAAALLASGRRDVSLVDHVSFELMRRARVDSALTVDVHFAEAGFAVVPS